MTDLLETTKSYDNNFILQNGENSFILPQCKEYEEKFLQIKYDEDFIKGKVNTILAKLLYGKQDSEKDKYDIVFYPSNQTIQKESNIEYIACDKTLKECVKLYKNKIKYNYTIKIEKCFEPRKEEKEGGIDIYGKDSKYFLVCLTIKYFYGE